MVHDDSNLPAQVGNDLPGLPMILAIVVTMPIWLPVAIVLGLVAEMFRRPR